MQEEVIIEEVIAEEELGKRCGWQSGLHCPQKVVKPWGYELIYAWSDKYVGKILHIAKGHQLSLQYHRQKDETIYVFEGLISLEIEDDNKNMVNYQLLAGQSYRILPFRKHRMLALEETDLLETSTPELYDVVRLEDRYGRV